MIGFVYIHMYVYVYIHIHIYVYYAHAHAHAHADSRYISVSSAKKPCFHMALLQQSSGFVRLFFGID